MKKRIIEIDYKKCGGCKLCEIACSLKHIKGINLEISRIRVFISEKFCIPIIAGCFTERPCKSKIVIKFDNEEISVCVFCRISCASKSIFKDPETNQPLQCELCGECVKWCPSGALAFVEK